MTWLIGYGHPNITYVCGHDGAVHANGVAVTEPDGWLTVPARPGDPSLGHHVPVEVRVRVGVEAAGHTQLYLEQVRRGGRDFAGVLAFAAAEGHDWLGYLNRQVHVELLKRLVAARTARESMRAPAMAGGGERP